MHKVKVKAWINKKTRLGDRKKVLLEKWVYVGDRIYYQMHCREGDSPHRTSMEVDDMVLMDWFLD